MPVAQYFPMPGHDGTDGTGQPPPLGTLIPWIALSVALTAIACVWLGRATVPLMLAVAAWAGQALVRQHGDARSIPSATPTAPHIRLVTPPRPQAPRAAASRPAPALRVVARSGTV